MARFEIVEGKPGQGKSLYMARTARFLFARNKKWFEKTGIVRPIVSNIRFSKEFEDEAGMFLKYWGSVEDVVKLQDCDLIWDEIATELDSRNFATISSELKRFLSQYRKRGVDIYANTQDFSMIDLRARLMITSVYTLNKIIGSPDPSPTKPPVTKIWGLVLMRQLEDFLADDPHNKKYFLLPSIFFISAEDVAMYDTRQDIPASPPLPLRHVERFCEFHGVPGHLCSFHKIVHS